MAMKEKDLNKLRRQDLLQLLLTETREWNRQEEELTELRGSLERLHSGNERLVERIREKEEQYERLYERLQHKHETLNTLRVQRSEQTKRTSLRLSDVSSESEVSHRLGRILASAQRQADAYLTSLSGA